MKNQSSQPKGFVFQKENYLIMLGGVLVIALGFLLMAMETAPHGFGTLALDVAPIVIIIGFLLQFVAIFYKKNQQNGLDTNEKPKL